MGWSAFGVGDRSRALWIASSCVRAARSGVGEDAPALCRLSARAGYVRNAGGGVGAGALARGRGEMGMKKAHPFPGAPVQCGRP